MNATQDLIDRLRKFVDVETCPVNESCITGFVSGAYNGWGWARERIGKILAKVRPFAIPHNAVCLFQDGSRWCAVWGDFINLQESPAGFGDTFEEAIVSLQSAARA